MNRPQQINMFHRRLFESRQPSRGFYLSGWSSHKSQTERFDALVRTSRFAGGTVVDYGCGTGDLYKYLAGLEYPFNYRGLDQNSQMVAFARSHYGNHFDTIPIDEVSFDEADYVFASGIFQFTDSSNPSYYIGLITELYAKCRKALSLNVLSSARSGENKAAGELYLDPPEVAALADTISKFWMIDHSYHVGGGDMTLAVYKREIDSTWVRGKQFESVGLHAFEKGLI